MSYLGGAKTTAQGPTSTGKKTAAELSTFGSSMVDSRDGPRGRGMIRDNRKLQNLQMN